MAPRRHGHGADLFPAAIGDNHSRVTSLPTLLVIIGPTASGKTALSLAIAKHFDVEIVSCDSVAVYRDFEIGTAKPSRVEWSAVPHHMIDVASPDERFTAGVDWHGA